MRFTSLILLFLCLFLWAPLSLATTSSRCVRSVNADTERFTTPDGEVIEFQVYDLAIIPRKRLTKLKRRIIRQFAKVDAFIPDRWQAIETNIILDQPSDNAYFMGGRTLRLPWQVRLEGRETDSLAGQIRIALYDKHPIKTNAVFHHERGHHILSLIFRMSSTSWSPFIQNRHKKVRLQRDIEKLDKRAAELEEIVDPWSPTATKALKTMDPALKEKMLSELESIREKMRNLEKELYDSENDLFSQMYDHIDSDLARELRHKFILLLNSYHELFADVVAILASANKNGELNPAAIHNSLYYSGRLDAKKVKEHRQINKERHFDRKISVKGWRTSSTHLKFNPTRFFLWRNLLSRPKYRRQRNWITELVANSIVDEISMYFDKAVKVQKEILPKLYNKDNSSSFTPTDQQNRDAFWDHSAEELNKSLIERINNNIIR